MRGVCDHGGEGPGNAGTAWMFDVARRMTTTRRGRRPHGPLRWLGRFLLGLLAGLVAWLAMSAAATVWVARQRSERPSDAAIVLGAAVQAGQPSPVFAARLDHAIDLYRRGVVHTLVLTGGVGEGDVVSESQAGAAYASARGVPVARILTESASHTTWRNLVEAHALVQAAGLGRCLLVSDPLHMRRALGMAERLGLDVEPSPTPTTRYASLRTQLPFLLREVYFQQQDLLLGE